MKKITALVLVVTTLAAQTIALASKEDIEVYLDGEKLAFDTAPEIVNDRTFVPLRAIVEGFGAKVDWDGEKQAITITKDETSNHLTIGNVNVSTEKDGKEDKSVLDAAPYIKDERTMVPLRYISEGFGMNVDWNGDDRVITITTNKKIEEASEQIDTYEGFDFIPDFGKFSGIEPDRVDAENNMYFYVNVSEEQQNKYISFLKRQGFVIADTMSLDTVVSVAYEKDDEQIIMGDFAGSEDYNSFFGITVKKKAQAYTGDIVYYEDYKSVPDFGVISGFERTDVQVNKDNTTTYTYTATSTQNKIDALNNYITLLIKDHFVEGEMTLSTIEFTKSSADSSVLIDQGYTDNTIKITVK